MVGVEAAGLAEGKGILRIHIVLAVYIKTFVDPLISLTVNDC